MTRDSALRWQRAKARCLLAIYKKVTDNFIYSDKVPKNRGLPKMKKHVTKKDGDNYYTDKRYILKRTDRIGSKIRYQFVVRKVSPYLRGKESKIRPLKTLKEDRRKQVIAVLTKKNLYYLKNPFMELYQYIALRSLKIMFIVLYTNERAYIRDCFEFYLQKYDIEFTRYADDSKDRVRRHRERKKALSHT